MIEDIEVGFFVAVIVILITLAIQKLKPGTEIL